MLMSLSRWPPPLHSSTSSSSSSPVTFARLLLVINKGSEGLLEFRAKVLVALCWYSLALIRAFSITWSCSAKWHWASSWLNDGDALAGHGEKERDDREMGREGQGMDMGELMLSLLGGEDEGLMLLEGIWLLPLVFSSTFSLGTLIQEIFSGMLCSSERLDAKRGGGGRGGGDCGKLSEALSFSLLQLGLILLSCC